MLGKAFICGRFLLHSMSKLNVVFPFRHSITPNLRVVPRLWQTSICSNNLDHDLCNFFRFGSGDPNPLSDAAPSHHATCKGSHSLFSLGSMTRPCGRDKTAKLAKVAAEMREVPSVLAKRRTWPLERKPPAKKFCASRAVRAESRYSWRQ